jgi:hypothetical protein
MTTETTNPTNGHEPAPHALLDFWSKAVEQSVEQTQALLEGFRSAADPAALRRHWLDTLAKGLDTTMRSPAFLETMRRNLEMMTQLKCTSEDWARDVTRSTGIPRITDISGLFERLQIGQEAILARLAAIEQRLETLESKRKRHNDG